MRKFRTLATVLFIATLVIVFTLTSPIATTFTQNADVALAQQTVITDKPIVVQNVPKEAIPVSTPTGLMSHETLIGTWSGKYKHPNGGDKYKLVFRSVTHDKKVAGILRAEGPLQCSYCGNDLPFTGTFTGEPGKETIRYASSNFIAGVVHRDGNKMSGSSQGTVTSTLDLTKTANDE